MAHIVLSIPKRKGRKLTHVTATLADWSVICADPDIVAQLEELKPEGLGYLPFPEMDWATLAERWLMARVVSVNPPSSDGPEIPGLCFSGGSLLTVPGLLRRSILSGPDGGHR